MRVNIYNQPFNLRSTEESGHVELVARIVDERMREVAEQLNSVDAFRIAVLAALNLADELCRVRQLLEASPAEPDEPTGASTLAQGGTTPAATVANAGTENVQPPRWSYEDIFDAAPPRKTAAGRMSDQVSSRLQSLRQSSHELTITNDDDDAAT